ncbi:OpgC protein [Leclercia adecarboxylata]|uniref:OpgC protein n=1 Tax=Leclercia adecarboxylata TaxID=83655 RepID=A0A4V6JJ27_9ENTR|nr:OpgC protein [Leclercia adecarboxylata]
MVFEVTHFTDRFSGTSWSLYPVTPQIKETWFNIILYLQIGPHQTQILGLYIFLLLLSPLFLGMLQRGHVYWLLGLSLLVYGCWQRWPVRVTPSEFEFAFPLLAWQFIFVLGMASGWYKEELHLLRPHLSGQSGGGGAGDRCARPWFCRQNHTNPFMPPALLMHVIPPAEFNAFYHTWAAKNGLGPIRVLNDICLMVTVYLAADMVLAAPCTGWQAGF